MFNFYKDTHTLFKKNNLYFEVLNNKVLKCCYFFLALKTYVCLYLQGTNENYTKLFKKYVQG